MHHASPHEWPKLNSRHLIALAWLLLAAQLFAQLHGLEHLEDKDHDGHSEAACHLCILSSSLDHGSVDTFVISNTWRQVARLVIADTANVTPRLLTSYQGRAPPTFSSTV